MTPALATAPEPRAARFTATTFAAFRISEGRTYSLGQVAGKSVDEALNGTLASKFADHKDHLLIRETGEKGVRLHLFAVRRKSQPTYVWEGHVQKRVHRLYADPVVMIDGGAPLNSNHSPRDGGTDRNVPPGE